MNSRNYFVHSPDFRPGKTIHLRLVLVNEHDRAPQALHVVH